MLDDLKPWQLLTIAGGSAVVMFTVLYVMLIILSGPKEPDAEPALPVATQRVVVANADIAPQTLIQENMLAVKELPVDAVPEGAILNFSEVVGQPAKTAIYTGDIVSRQKLMDGTEPAGFVGTIPKDCRALSIRVNEITGVAGFVRPGDFVDVVLVEKDEQKAKSTLLLQNVLLLSIDKQTMSGMGMKGLPTDGKAAASEAAPSVATLALPPDDALELVAASQLGELYLMLRPFHPGNMYVVGTEHTVRSSKTPSLADLQKEQMSVPQPPAMPQQTAPQPAAPAQSQSAAGGQMEIIHGDKVVAQ